MNKIATFLDDSKLWMAQPFRYPNKWTIRIIEPGDQYGLDDCLTHGKDFLGTTRDIDHEFYGPMVEFFDPDGKQTILGQFVSRYYITTLLDPKWKNCGLDLEGGSAKWSVPWEMMNDIRSYLKSFIEQ